MYKYIMRRVEHILEFKSYKKNNVFINHRYFQYFLSREDFVKRAIFLAIIRK